MLTVRALFETLAIKHCGEGDLRTFNDKLSALVKADFIRSSQVDYLNKAIYDAGSATMHRGYNPSEKAVGFVLDEVEMLMRTIYIQPKVREELEQEVPQRERKKKNA